MAVTWATWVTCSFTALLSSLVWIITVTEASLTHTMLDGDCPGPSTLYVRESVQVSLCRNPHQYVEQASVHCSLIFRAQHHRFRLLLVWDLVILNEGADNTLAVSDRFSTNGPQVTRLSSPLLSYGNVVEIIYHGQPHLDTFRLTVTEVLVSSECTENFFQCNFMWPAYCIAESLLCNGENNCGDNSDEKLPMCMTNQERNTPPPTSSSSVLPLGLMAALGGVVFALIILVIICAILHVVRKRRRQYAGQPSGQGAPLNPDTRALDEQLTRVAPRQSNEYVPLPPPGSTTKPQPAHRPHHYENSENRELPDLFQLADMNDMLLLHTAGYPRPLLPHRTNFQEVSISEPGYMDISNLSSGYPQNEEGEEEEEEENRAPSLPPSRTAHPPPILPHTSHPTRGKEPTHEVIDFTPHWSSALHDSLPPRQPGTRPLLTRPERQVEPYQEENTHFYLHQFSSPHPS